MNNPELSSEVHSANGSSEVSDLLRKGIKSAQEGNRSEARNLLMQATELEPKNENAWLWLASISEYPEELLIFLNNVLRINPTNERALEWEKSTKALLSKTFVQRGIEASNNSQADFAKQCFLQAIVHDDKNEMAWLWLASISESVDEKKSHLHKVLKLNPENETAKESLNAIMSEMSAAKLRAAQEEAIAGNAGKASKMLAELLKSSSEIADAWVLKAHLTDSFAEKVSSLEKAVEIESDHENAVKALDALRSAAEFTTPYPAESKAVEVPIVPLPEPEPFEESNSLLDLTDQTAEAEMEAPVEEEEMVSEPEAVFQEEAELVEEVDAVEEFSASDADSEVFEEIQNGIEAPSEPLADYSQFDVPSYETVIEQSQSFEAEQTQYFEETEVEEAVFAETEESEPAIDPVPVMEEEMEVPESIPMPDAMLADAEDDSAPKAVMVECSFCGSENDEHNIICGNCRAMTTISDVEMMLAYQDADEDIIREKIERLEAETASVERSVETLKVLGIGSLNLKQHKKGFDFLQEASNLDPNDVVLSSHVNSLAIRLSEIESKDTQTISIPENKTILVVDDSATVRKLVSGKLEKCGLDVICAVDGMDALEKINENIPDLILLDITMPRMDGYQVCKLIRGNEATKDVPVVMISGKDGFFDKVRGRMAGTTGYITKPFGPETLMKTVEAYIE